jgi:DNA transposition AAA+ family ATPase
MTIPATRLSLIEQANFSNEKPHEIRDRLKSLVEAGELTLREISKVTNYSASVISQVLNGVYEGDTEKTDDALSRFYRQWVAKNAIVTTRVVQEIHNVMELAWRRKEIALIRGKFGRGKTKAAGKYAANHDYALFVELTGVTSATELLHRTAEALNIQNQMSGTRSDKLQLIIRNVQRNPRLFIIDEADELSGRTLALIKDIHGEGTGRCGIVLMATERLDKILLKPELGYLRRRITIKREIGDMSLAEAKSICNMWPNSLSEESIKEAFKWSVSHFGVASLVNLLKRAYDEHQLNGTKKIDDDCMEAAYSWLVD